MDPVVAVLGFAGLGLVIWVSVLSGQKRRAELARHLGLELRRGRAWGRVAGFGVDLEGSGPFHLVVELGAGHLEVDFAPVTIHMQGFVTGDPGFDDLVVMQGAREVLCPLLDVATRARLRALAQAGAQMEGSRLAVHVAGDHEATARLLGVMVELAARLRPTHRRTQFLETLSQEIEPEVARRSLEVFQEEWVPTPDERRSLLTQPHLEVRLALAATLQPPAFDQMVEMASNLSNSLQIRRRALAAIGRLAPEYAVGPALEIVTSEGDPALATTALEVLASARVCPPLTDLLPHLQASGGQRLGATRCLRWSEEAIEAMLIELLHQRDPLVAEAAARALKTHGTPAAVQPLRARALSAQSDALAETISDAVATIQGRVSVQAGALSIQVDEVGGLAVAEEVGGLALANDVGGLAVAERPEET